MLLKQKKERQKYLLTLKYKLFLSFSFCNKILNFDFITFDFQT